MAPTPAVAQTSSGIRFLTILTDRPGEIVSLAELRDQLWGDRHLEWEKSLYHCVREARKALGDSGRNPRLIENVPRRGYRFLETVESVRPAATEGSRRGPAVRAWLAVSGATAIAGLVEALRSE